MKIWMSLSFFREDPPDCCPHMSMVGRSLPDSLLVLSVNSATSYDVVEVEQDREHVMYKPADIFLY